MEVPDPNADNAPPPENDMSRHFAPASSAVADLLKDLPADSNDPEQRGATPAAPDPSATTAGPSGGSSSVEPPLPAAGSSPAAPKAGESDDAFKQELDAIKIPKNAHPNVKQGITAMRQVAERERNLAQENAKKAQAAETRIAELEKKAMTPEIEAEMKDLKELRRMIDIKSDPEFKSKYTAPIELGNSRASQILTRHGLDAELVQSITKLGGLSAAARSNEKVPAEIDDKQPSWAEWIEKTLLPKVPSIDRNRLQGIIAHNADLEDEMQSEIDALAKDPTSFQEKFEKRNIAAMEEGVNEAKKALGRMAEKWEVPANATPEQKAAVDKHNARYEKAEKAAQEMFESIRNNPRAQGRAALIFGQAVYLSEANQELMTTVETQGKTIAELTKKLEAIKSSGSITASLNAAPPQSVPETSLKNLGDHNAATRRATQEVLSEE